MIEKRGPPFRHIRLNLSIVDNRYKLTGGGEAPTRNTSRLRFLHFSLKGKATEWLDRIPPLKSRRGISSYDPWDDMSPPMNISSISEAMQPTLRGRLKRVCNQIAYLETPTQEVGLKNPYLICDYCGGSHEADECKQTNRAEQVCLSEGDIYDDPSLMSKFEDELANFMLEKKSHAKGIRDMLVQHRISIQDPPFSASPRPATDNFTEGEIEKEGLEGAEPNIIQEPAPQPSILYQPSKSSNLSFLSKLKKQKKDDEDKRLLSIFKQIHINLPFLESMIHMPKGAKVLKDLLSNKEKLKKAASSVKLSEECSTIIQRSLPQKEEDP
ncbi:hypothetical protein Tco_0576323 [Tanacetum coccineum]